MKKAKKMALQAMVCAAFAAAMVLAGCTDEVSNEGDQTGVSVSDDGMKITYDSKGNDGDKDFMRVFTQFAEGKSVKNSVEEVTCTIRQTNVETDNKSVFGFMFDLHRTEDKDTKAVTYDYYVVGIRPCDRNYYIEHYKGVPEGSFVGAANDVTIAATGVETKHWTGSTWADNEGPFLSGSSFMKELAGTTLTTVVKVKKTKDGTDSYYTISFNDQETTISCKSVDPNAEKGGVAAYSCIYKGKTIAGTMELSGLKGALNLEVAEAE